MKRLHQGGFTFIEIIIALVVVGVISGATYFVVKEEGNKKAPAATTQPTPTPTVTPTIFPKKPTVSAAGDWHGDFTVSAPADCAGQSGGWQATLTDTDGTIGGSYSADGGFSGAVSGTVTADTASFKVANASGAISFTGAISGNTITGGFTGVSCSGQSSDDLTSGSFFGGRTVPQ